MDFLFLSTSKAMSIWLNKLPFLFLNLKENCFIGQLTTFVETFAILSFSLPFLFLLSSLVSLPLSFPRFLLDWTFPETKVIPLRVEYYPLIIPFHFSFVVLELTSLSPYQICHSCINVSDFLSPRSSSCFIIPTSFIFVVFYFCFNSYMLSTFFRIFFFITLYFRNFVYIFFSVNRFTVLSFRCIEE